MIGIVISRPDKASSLIGDQLLSIESWDECYDESLPDKKGGGKYYTLPEVSLREFDDLHINLTNLDTVFSDVDLIVFPSRHAGETGPVLTTHFTGNIGPADYGGKDNSVSIAAPTIQKHANAYLRVNAPSDFDVGIEATHHGPLITHVPSLFIEIGSSATEWTNPTPARVIADTILDLPTQSSPVDRVVVGFGGGHYAPRFERILDATDWCVGHIAADWSLNRLSTLESEVIEQLFERSHSEIAIIDGSLPELESYLDSLGYRVVSETYVRETTGIPLELVDRLESEFGTINEGLRFGELADETIDYTAYQLGEDLITEANGIDPQKTRSLMEHHAMGFLTRENGNLVTGAVAVPSEDEIRSITNGILRIFDAVYESVEQSDDAIRVTGREFKPELAKEKGVEEGPDFGRLASGESVDVNDTTVTPEMVFKNETKTIPISLEKLQ